jgi:hypothetical protein
LPPLQHIHAATEENILREARQRGEVVCFDWHQSSQAGHTMGFKTLVVHGMNACHCVTSHLSYLCTCYVHVSVGCLVGVWALFVCAFVCLLV